MNKKKKFTPKVQRKKSSKQSPDVCFLETPAIDDRMENRSSQFPCSLSRDQFFHDLNAHLIHLIHQKRNTSDSTWNYNPTLNGSAYYLTKLMGICHIMMARKWNEPGRHLLLQPFPPSSSFSNNELETDESGEDDVRHDAVSWGWRRFALASNQRKYRNLYDSASPANVNPSAYESNVASKPEEPSESISPPSKSMQMTAAAMNCSAISVLVEHARCYPHLPIEWPSVRALRNSEKTCPVHQVAVQIHSQLQQLQLANKTKWDLEAEQRLELVNKDLVPQRSSNPLFKHFHEFFWYLSIADAVISRKLSSSQPTPIEDESQWYMNDRYK